MRILILSVTAGEGHNTCAAALREALERRGHEVTVADLYRCCGVPSRLTDRIYRTCAKDFRQKYSRTYTRLERDERFRRRWEKELGEDAVLRLSDVSERYLLRRAERGFSALDYWKKIRSF